MIKYVVFLLHISEFLLACRLTVIASVPSGKCCNSTVCDPDLETCKELEEEEEEDYDPHIEPTALCQHFTMLGCYFSHLQFYLSQL